MRHTIRVPCAVCAATGEVVDQEMGLHVVCYGCMGLRYVHTNAGAPCCDLETHEEVRPEEATP